MKHAGKLHSTRRKSAQQAKRGSGAPTHRNPNDSSSEHSLSSRSSAINKSSARRRRTTSSLHNASKKSHSNKASASHRRSTISSPRLKSPRSQRKVAKRPISPTSRPQLHKLQNAPASSKHLLNSSHDQTASLNTSLTPRKLKLRLQQKLNKLHQSKKPKLSSPRYTSPPMSRKRHSAANQSSKRQPTLHQSQSRPASPSSERNRPSISTTSIASDGGVRAPTSPASPLPPTPTSAHSTTSLLMQRLANSLHASEQHYDINGATNIFQDPEKELLNKFYSLHKHRREKMLGEKVNEEKNRQYFRKNALRMMQLVKEATDTDLPLEQRLDSLRKLNDIEQRDLTTANYEKTQDSLNSTSSAEWNHIQSKFMQHFNDPEYHDRLLKEHLEREKLSLEEYSFKPQTNNNEHVTPLYMDHMKDPKYNPSSVRNDLFQKQDNGLPSTRISTVNSNGSAPSSSTKKLKARKPTESFKRLTSPRRRHTATQSTKTTAARTTSPTRVSATNTRSRRPLSPRSNNTLSSSSRANRTLSPKRVKSPMRSKSPSSSGVKRRKLVSPKRQQHRNDDISTPLVKRSARRKRQQQNTTVQQGVLLSTAKGSFVDL